MLEEGVVGITAQQPSDYTLKQKHLADLNTVVIPHLEDKA